MAERSLLLRSQSGGGWVRRCHVSSRPAMLPEDPQCPGQSMPTPPLLKQQQQAPTPATTVVQMNQRTYGQIPVSQNILHRARRFHTSRPSLSSGSPDSLPFLCMCVFHLVARRRKMGAGSVRRGWRKQGSCREFPQTVPGFARSEP